MKVSQRITGRRWMRQRVGMLAAFLFASAFAPSTAHGDYVEVYQTWTASSADTWEEKDLSGDPYYVPANAVVEVAVMNRYASAELWGGVRAVGSSLDRRFLLQEAEGDGGGSQGRDVVVMHVQTDSNSKIEHYSDNTTYVSFVLLGYWTCPTYVEKYQSFKAGASLSWQDHDLSTYGVSANEVAEIVLVNNSSINEREAGVRTNGSGLSRICDLHEAEDGGDDVGTMFVKADGTANATIEVYAESDTDVDFYLVGYWTTPPGTYTEKFSDIGSPSSDSTWRDKDLSSYGVSAGHVAEIAFANKYALDENYTGVRENGSSLGRLLDLHEAEDGGGDYARMQVAADATSTIEFYHEDVSDAHQFLLIGYWELDPVLTLYDHDAGQESNAFSGSGGETNAELFAFELDPGSDTISVTQLVFTLSDIAGLTDGDWAGIEIGVDANSNGTISVGESSRVGGDGVVSTAAGTITFSTSFNVTAATSYILRADFSSLTQCDSVTISLTKGNITTTAMKSGSTTSVTHAEAGVIANLVGHWKLDDGAGTTADDSSTGNRDGAVVGTPTWTDGRLCGAVSFDESDDHVWVSDFSYGPDFSVSFWFKVDDNTGTDFQYMFSHGGPGWLNSFHVFLVEGTSPSAIVRTDLMDNNDTDDATALDFTANVIGTGWHHYAAVMKSGTGAKVYLDGTERATDATRGGDSINPTTNIYLGRRSDGQAQRYYGGLLDDIRIYDDALLVAEVQDLAATYKVIDLGTLSEARSLGFSINDSEQIAGYDEDSATGNTSAWLCKTCAFTSIGTFAGGSVAEALGINSAGEVVGWSDNAAGDRKAFFYDGSLTDLGTLSGRSDSEAFAVNSSDEVVGTALNFGLLPTDRLAFLYLPLDAYGLSAGINSLGTLGGDQSVAMDINDSGQVVGGAENASGNMRPFRWANGSMTNLGTLGGENWTILHRAQAINSSGDVVGLSYTAGGDAHAFLYDGSMTDLGVLTGGDTSLAYDINDDDKIVGTSNVTGGDFHAFIYQDSTMTDLNDLIDTNSTWTLIRATGINDDGEIVGWGENPDGDYHAFLLIQTCSGSGPPGGIAGFLAGGSALTDPNGDFEETVVSPDGEPLGEIVVVDADPGEPFTYSVTAPGSGTNGAPGPGLGTLAGFADGVALKRTMTVASPAPLGSFNLTVSMSFFDGELADEGVAPEDVELHVLDKSLVSRLGVWVPAGVNIGESEPTDVVGDSGFVVYTDGTVDFWAVRDAVGVFAVGVRSVEQDTDGDPEDDDGDSDVTPAPRRLPPFCGLGMLPCGLAALVTLVATRSRRSRH